MIGAGAISTLRSGRPLRADQDDDEEIARNETRMNIETVADGMQDGSVRRRISRGNNGDDDSDGARALEHGGGDMDGHQDSTDRTSRKRSRSGRSRSPLSPARRRYHREVETPERYINYSEDDRDDQHRPSVLGDHYAQAEGIRRRRALAP